VTPSVLAKKAAVPFTIFIALTVTGCAQGFIDGSIEEGVESGIDNQADPENVGGEVGDVDIDLAATDGAEIPANWPVKVPLPPGLAINSATLGTSMSISYDMSDVPTAAAHVAAIKTAGFTVKDSVDNGPDGARWTFEDGTYLVTYNYMDSGRGDGSAIAQIGVQEEIQ